MKNNILFVVFFIVSCKNLSNKIPLSEPMSKIKFEKDTFYFNSIQKGDSIIASFPFQNISKSPLIIKNMEASCGCTKVFFRRDTIAIGGKDTIHIQYNSKNDDGEILKTTIVETNTEPALNVLFIKGHVLNTQKNKP